MTSRYHACAFAYDVYFFVRLLVLLPDYITTHLFTTYFHSLAVKMRTKFILLAVSG